MKKTLKAKEVEILLNELDSIHYNYYYRTLDTATSQLPKRFLKSNLYTLRNLKDLVDGLYGQIESIHCNSIDGATSLDEYYCLRKIIKKYYGSKEWKLLGSKIYNILYKWYDSNNYFEKKS